MQCPVCEATGPDGARFCSTCGAPLAAQPESGAEARKTVTALFCDMTDSTALSDRIDAEAFRAVMIRYYDVMRECLQRHGGTVEKFVGDAVMAIFGVPQVHEDDALRAARAAMEMRVAIAALNDELRLAGTPVGIRIGINTGEVVTSGDPNAGQVLTSGEAVNVAARLEQHAAPGEILLGPDTARALAGSAITEAVGPLALKGKSEPVAPRRLLDLHPDAPAIARNFDLPLIGRDREMQQLELILDRVTEDCSCHLVTLFGDAGAGKSRLAREFGALAAQRGALVGVGSCQPYGRGRTMHALGDAFRQLVGPDAENAELSASAVADTDAADALAALREGLLRDGSPGVPPDQLRWAVAEILETLGRSRPVVLVLDDLQWSQPMLLDLVDHISDWSTGASIVLLCCSRPDLLERRADWASGKLNATSLTLPALDASDCQVLVAAASEVEIHGADLADRIVERCEGNPLYLEQLVAMVADHDDEDALPPTIQALITARLDLIDAAERELLLCATVLGRQFTLAGLRVAVGHPAGGAAEIAPMLRALTRRRLIEPVRTNGGEETYRFASTLIQEVGYAAVPKRLRAERHEALARAFAEQDGMADDVADHLERAYRMRSDLGLLDGDTERLRAEAASHLSRAGLAAVRCADLQWAADLLGRATAIAEPGDPDRLAAAEQFGEVRLLLGAVEEGVALLREVLLEAVVAGDLRVAGHARLQLAFVESPDVGLQASVAAATEALPVFEQTGDRLGLTRAWLRIGQASQAEGKFAAADASLWRALGHVQHIHAELERATVLGALATSLLCGPRPAQEAIGRCRELVAQQVNGRRAARAALSCPLAVLLAFRAEFGEARELLADANRIVGELGHAYATASIGVFLASIESMQGNWEPAEQLLRHSAEELQRLGDAQMFATASHDLARVLLARGDFAGAFAFVDPALSAATPTLAAELSGVKARVLAERGAGGAALQVVGAAVDVAERTDSTTCRAMARLDRAHVLRTLGDRDGMLAEAAASGRLFRAKGHLVGERLADALRMGE